MTNQYTYTPEVVERANKLLSDFYSEYYKMMEDMANEDEGIRITPYERQRMERLNPKSS